MLVYTYPSNSERAAKFAARCCPFHPRLTLGGFAFFNHPITAAMITSNAPTHSGGLSGKASILRVKDQR